MNYTSTCHTQVENIMDNNKHIYIPHFQFEQLVLHMLEKLKSAHSHTALMELKVRTVKYNVLSLVCYYVLSYNVLLSLLSLMYNNLICD